jgi:hypothetical protein
LRYKGETEMTIIPGIGFNDNGIDKKTTNWN